MTARLPSLNGLRAFEAAARHLSFTLAASELNVTQTAISHQIRRLEEELGIRLFIRQNRALALTPEARDYLPGVRAAFNDLRLATDRLLRKDDDKVLIYLLSHKSKDDAVKSFDTFRQDPDWKTAKDASEKKGGGSLTEAKGGVISEFLEPTVYSPLK